MSHETGSNLLARYVRGDVESERTLRSWVQEVVRFGRWRFDDPESIIQDVMIRLLLAARAGRYRAESGPRTFVRSVTKHACIDAHRRAILVSRIEGAATEAEAPTSPGEDPESILEERERMERLRYVIEILSEECRRLWRWVYQEGLSSRAVSERLGISEGAVRGRAHRCLNQARRIARSHLEGAV